MFSLALAILVVCAAPLLSTAMVKRPAASSAFDAFVLMVSLGAVTLGLLPEVVDHTGLLGLGIAAIGFLLPGIAESLFHRSAEGTHRWSLVLAAGVLVIHAAADGAILAGLGVGSSLLPSDGAAWVLIPLILHRFGVALALWWLLRPYFSRAVRWIILLALSASTVLGYSLLETGLSGEAAHQVEWGIDLLLAFGCGSLLHILLHPVASGAPSTNTLTTLAAHRIGTAIGLALVLAMTWSHLASHSTTDPLATDNLIHGLDQVMNTGLLLSPVLMLLLLILPATRMLFAVSRQAFTAALCWGVGISVAVWLGSGLMIPHLVGDVLPVNALSEALWLGWIAAIMLVLVSRGARPFLTGLLPSRLFHSHSHQ